MSGDKGQDYFSDDCRRKLLNSLARIIELQVAARTLILLLQGRTQRSCDHRAQVNVESVLEGAAAFGSTILRYRQLKQCVTGLSPLADSDRDLGDVLRYNTLPCGSKCPVRVNVTPVGNLLRRSKGGGTASTRRNSTRNARPTAYRGSGPAKTWPREGLNKEGTQYAVFFRRFHRGHSRGPDYALATAAGRSQLRTLPSLVEGPEVGDYLNKAPRMGAKRLRWRLISQTALGWPFLRRVARADGRSSRIRRALALAPAMQEYWGVRRVIAVRIGRTKPLGRRQDCGYWIR